MSQFKRIDRILANLKRKQARGGLTYEQAVDVHCLISAFEHIRSLVAEELETGHGDTLALTRDRLGRFVKGRS